METLTRTTKTLRGAALVLLAVVALVVGTATPAGAHSELESATPADGARVTEPVGRIDLVFASALLPESIEAVVIVDGVPVEATVAVADDTRFVTLEPAQPMTTGDVGVAIRAVADDGHTVEVSVGFAVDAPAPPPTTAPPTTAAPATTSTTSPPTTAASTTTVGASEASEDDTSVIVATEGGDGADPDDAASDSAAAAAAALSGDGADAWEDAQTVVRALTYLATIVAAGIAAFLVLVARGPAEGPDVAPPPGRAVTVGTTAAAALVVLTLAWAAVQAGLVAGGEVDAALDPTEWLPALSGDLVTGFWLRLAGAVALGLGLVLRRRRVALGGAGIACASYAFSGHAGSADIPVLAQTSAVVHVAALSIWLGGLLALVLTSRAAVREDGAASWAAPVVGRFSRLAGWTLAATIVAGSALALGRLDGPSDLVDTSYGRVLSLKLVVVAAVIGLGTYNRVNVVDPLRRAAASGRDALTTRLQRVGSAELGAAAVVTVLTAVLVGSA